MVEEEGMDNGNTEQSMFNPRTMFPSSNSWTGESVPFITNLEFKTSSELSRRRGTQRYKPTYTGTDTFKRNLATNFVIVKLKPNALNATIRRIAVEVTAVETVNSTGSFVYYLNVAFTYVDSTTSTNQQVLLPLPPNVDAVNAKRIINSGVQLYSSSTGNATSTATIFVYFGSGSTNVQQVVRKINVEFVGTTTVLTASLTTSSITLGPGSPGTTAVSSSRRKTISGGINRIFFSDENILYYTPVISPTGGVSESLTNTLVLGVQDVITRVVEQDNRLWIITAYTVYVADIEVDASSNYTLINARTICRNVLSVGNRSVLVVGNQCYIPTAEANIYKLNLKTNQINIASYSELVGSPVRELVKGAECVSSYYDDFNNSINFVFTGILQAVTEIYSKAPISNTQGRNPNLREGVDSTITPIETIVITKTYSAQYESADAELWTSTLFNYEICGVNSYTIKKTDDEYNTSFPINKANLQSTLVQSRSPVTKKNTDLISDYLAVHPVASYIPYIFEMREELVTDDDSQFPVIMSIPMLYCQPYISVNKKYMPRTLSMLISTGFKNKQHIIQTNTEELKKRVIDSVIIKQAEMVSSLSTPPQFLESDKEIKAEVVSYAQNSVFNIQVNVNNALWNGAVFAYFKSGAIDDFLGFRLDG